MDVFLLLLFYYTNAGLPALLRPENRSLNFIKRRIVPVDMNKEQTAFHAKRLSNCSKSL
jgi:hypothetical protein